MFSINSSTFIFLSQTQMKVVLAAVEVAVTVEVVTTVSSLVPAPGSINLNPANW